VGVEHHFLLVHRRCDSSPVENQIGCLFEELGARLAEIEAGFEGIARLSFFLRGMDLVEHANAAVKRAFGERHPPTEVLVQPPVPDGVAVLAWVVTGDGCAVERPIQNVSRIVRRSADLAIVGQITAPLAETESADCFTACFRELTEKLSAIDLDCSDIVKTWTWFPSVDNATAVGGFQGFNAARRAFFAPIAFDRYRARDGGRRYPANTGVGVYQPQATISAIAAGGRSLLVPIENPAQTSAFEYTTKRIATPALFSRAMAVVSDSEAMVFVSGTGSVVGAETAHIGDPARQAEQVLRNLEMLLARDNLAHSGVAVERGGIEQLAYLLAFATTREGELAMADACARTLPERCPVLIVRAPLSRGELLVEAEGVATMSLSSS
jgi:enamine deaminase RidA (YjgF/YER057c/UK114 family)